MAYTDTNEDEQIVPFVQDDDHSDVLSMLGLAPETDQTEQDRGTYTKPQDVSADEADASGLLAPAMKADDAGSDDLLTPQFAPRDEGKKDFSVVPPIFNVAPETKPSPQASTPAITPQIASPVQAASGPQPVTTPYDNRLKADQARIDALQAKGSGVSQHHGFVGGLLKAADIAGSILAPHAMAVIPGTTLNYKQNLATAQGRLGQDTENQSKQVQVADQQAQIAQRQDALNALKAVGTPIETAQGTFQTFTDKHGNPVTKKLDIPAGKSSDYELKEAVDPKTGKTVYASVNKADPNDVRYTDAAVAPKDGGPIDSSDKALAVVNKTHQAYADAVAAGDPQKIEKAKNDLTVAMQNYNNFVASATNIAGRKSAAEAAGRAPEQAANRAAGMTTEMTKKGAELATKADADFNDVLSKANNIKTSIQAARNGNELAASIAPLQTTLFITTSEGVKRINETELKGVSGAGSLVQELNGWFSKKTSGDPIPDKIKSDMVALMNLYSQSAADKYQRTIKSVNDRHGTNFQPSSDLMSSATSGTASDTIQVQIPGHPPGTIAASKKDEFLKKYPNAKVLQ
jgi:hypothetical protein